MYLDSRHLSKAQYNDVVANLLDAYNTDLGETQLGYLPAPKALLPPPEIPVIHQPNMPPRQAPPCLPPAEHRGQRCRSACAPSWLCRLRPGSSVTCPRLLAIAVKHPLQHPCETPIEGLVTAKHPLTSASISTTFCCPPHFEFEGSSYSLPPLSPVPQPNLAGHKPPMRPAEATSVRRT